MLRLLFALLLVGCVETEPEPMSHGADAGIAADAYDDGCMFHAEGVSCYHLPSGGHWCLAGCEMPGPPPEHPVCSGDCVNGCGLADLACCDGSIGTVYACPE